MNEFLKELTELSLKYKLVLAGSGVYYCFKADKCAHDLKGKYILSPLDENDDKIEWIDE